MHKIAVIGTHSTGKSVLCNKLCSYLKDLGFKVNIVSELARKCPFPLNESSTVEAQRWILLNQIEEENNNKDCDFLVCDRSVLDNYIYLFNILGKDHEGLHDAMIKHLETYDVLFLASIKSEDIPKDGFRSVSKEFRLRINDLLINKIHSLSSFLTENNINLVKIRSFEDIKNSDILNNLIK